MCYTTMASLDKCTYCSCEWLYSHRGRRSNCCELCWRLQGSRISPKRLLNYELKQLHNLKEFVMSNISSLLLFLRQYNQADKMLLRSCQKSQTTEKQWSILLRALLSHKDTLIIRNCGCTKIHIDQKAFKTINITYKCYRRSELIISRFNGEEDNPYKFHCASRPDDTKGMCSFCNKFGCFGCGSQNSSGEWAITHINFKT